MADILPECLIQKILCFLSYTEATRMRILSKTWLQAWSTLPNLDFTIDCWEGNTMSDYSQLVDTIIERYRKGKIPIERFELLENINDSHKDFYFPLIDKWLDIALQNGVKDLFLEFTSYPTPILTILAGKSLRELVLCYCTLMPVSLSSGVVNCNSLRKLSLSHVTLDENTFDTLFNSCPLIVSFILEYCSGLTMTLRKIKSDSLKVLKIHQLYAIEEIDAPNLVSLDYMGNQIPELKMARESSQLEHSKITLLCRSSNAAWFCKLKKLLSNSSSSSKVTLQFFNCTEISMTDLQMDHIDLYDKPIESTSSSFVEVTVGHEGDKARMIDQLLDEHESKLDVISIVGMPGLGKTTLAKKVYNNTLVASHFNVRAWCIISQKYNKSKVLREILQQVTGSEGKESEDDFAENYEEYYSIKGTSSS
uniref:Hero resistance protein n=1 Tax=Solanum tuberosum TaxID=4113 RepID=M0ZWU1_SOLTU